MWRRPWRRCIPNMLKRHFFKSSPSFNNSCDLPGNALFKGSTPLDLELFLRCNTFSWKSCYGSTFIHWWHWGQRMAACHVFEEKLSPMVHTRWGPLPLIKQGYNSTCRGWNKNQLQYPFIFQPFFSGVSKPSKRWVGCFGSPQHLDVCYLKWIISPWPWYTLCRFYGFQVWFKKKCPEICWIQLDIHLSPECWGGFPKRHGLVRDIKNTLP